MSRHEIDGHENAGHVPDPETLNWSCPVPCLGPRSTRSCGGPQTLEGAAREWEKCRLELKRAIPE